MYELMPHQKKFSKELLNVLLKYGCVFLIGEVRSQKTGTVLQACNLYKAKDVLFITKKKAIPSILSDYNNFIFNYNIEVINYESIHKIKNTKPDLVVYDESHGISGFPKPAKRTKQIKELFFDIPCIWLTGTPAAETASQYYHQFYVNKNSPFKEYKSFYKWAKDYVNVTKKRIGTHEVNDYTDAYIEKIMQKINPYIVRMTQQDAGFENNLTIKTLEVDTPTKLNKLAKQLLKDRVVVGKTGNIMGDLPAKLQSKVHQIYNGTVIIENEYQETKPIILSDYKAEFIKHKFKGKKIAILYYYKAELEILNNTFGNNITTDLEEFNSTNKNFALQQSSSEGLNLSKADYLVVLNFGFSGKNWIQCVDRMTVKCRKDNTVFVILEKGGINGKIYNRLKDKESYNLKSFLKDYETTI